jgi:hypothetical protein
MRFYNQPHRFYAGVDRRARAMYVCVSLTPAPWFCTSPTIRPRTKTVIASSILPKLPP